MPARPLRLVRDPLDDAPAPAADVPTPSPARRRPKGTGSIVVTNDGRFLARLPMGTTPDGKRDVLSQRFTTRKAAEQWLREQGARRDRGELRTVDRDGQTLAGWLEEFYTKHRVGRKNRLLSDATVAKDREAIRTYLLRANPALAATPLVKLTTDALAQHFAALAGRGLARNTVARLHRIVRARLQFAVKKGKLRSNPLTSLEAADTLVIDGTAPRRHVVLSPAQAAAVLAEAPAHRHGVFFATMLLTGMRPGEVAGLTWADVDLAARRVTVRQSLERLRGADSGGGWRLKAPKTDRSVRSLPIGERLVTMLTAHREADAAHVAMFRDGATGRLAPEYHDHGLVFHSTFGEPLHLETLPRRYLRPLLVAAACRLTGTTLPPVPGRRSTDYRDAVTAREAAETAVLAAADMPALTMYELRHTAATMLLQSNVHVKIVQDRLGHARASTTLDIYSHVTPDLQDVAVDAMEQALERGAAAPPPAPATPDPASLRRRRRKAQS